MCRCSLAPRMARRSAMLSGGVRRMDQAELLVVCPGLCTALREAVKVLRAAALAAVAEAVSVTHVHVVTP